MRAGKTRARLRWLEVRLQADGETAEAISEFFGRLGSGGAVLEHLVPERASDDAIRQCWVKAYMPVRSPEEERLQRRRVEEGLWHLSQMRPLGQPEFRLLADEDWAESWKAAYRPLVLGQHLVIKPSWCEWQAGEGQIVVELDPGQAFGTGLHPSTQLCLIGLEKWIRSGQNVLDLGTGSGILAIAAAQLGARAVLALDTDSLAVNIAERNARANGVADKIKVVHGSLPPRDATDRVVADLAWRMAPTGFDLILVNILAEVIADLMERGLANWLAPAGILIAAGIIRERHELVAKAMRQAGLLMIEQSEQGDWISLIARVPCKTL